MNKVAIKNLLPGERFILDHATVYTVVSVRTGGGKTVVGYRIGDHKRVDEFVRPSLSTATIVGTV